MRDHSLRHRALAAAVVAAAAVLALCAPARAGETTVPIAGIGTTLPGIATHADSVTYSDPEVVDAPGFGRAIEVRGTVRGVGWGGVGIVARPNAHYAYEMPFVARWRPGGGSQTLVTHHHGGNVPLLAILQRDKLVGAANPNRIAENSGDLTVGFPALLDHCVYVATNRRGLNAAGALTARFTPDVAPLTAAEAASLQAAIAGAPGTPGYARPELVAGAPVPLTMHTDAITMRDIDRALERVVASVSRCSERRFRARIFVGISAGSVVGGGVAFGRVPFKGESVWTGGNQVVPGDASSAPLFDGFIFNGWVYDSAVERVDRGIPISAPVFILQGRADERYQQPIALADELIQRGVHLDSWLRIYEIRNLPHVSRDNPLEVAPADDNGETLGCYMSAAIENMQDLLHRGAEPPVSRIAGRIDAAGALAIDVVGGIARQAPLVEDQALDAILFPPPPSPPVVARPFGALEAQRWAHVTAELDHVSDAITGPSIAARVGGYGHKFFGSALTPFDAATLLGMYGSFKGYRRAVRDAVRDLERARLYDPRVESPKETAARSAALFGVTAAAAAEDD